MFEEYGQPVVSATLLEALGARPGDYKTGFLRLAELYVPAFKEPVKRGAKPGRRVMRAEKTVDEVEAVKREKNLKTDAEAIREIDQDLKKSKSKFTKAKNHVSIARRLTGRPAKRRSA